MAGAGQSHSMRPAQRVFVRRVVCDPSLRHPCASRGPESYWIPACAGKTSKGGVTLKTRRRLMCPCPLRHPCARRGPEPMRLYNTARGMRPPAGVLGSLAPFRHPCESRGPEPYPCTTTLTHWISACAEKTLKGGVTSCARMPTGFLLARNDVKRRRPAGSGAAPGPVPPANRVENP